MNTDFTVQLRGCKLTLMTSAILALQLLAGCGENLSVPATVPVSGFVTYKGKPVSGVRVKFYRAGGSYEKQFIPTGETGTDGSFVLSTGAPLNGAPAGDYDVVFEWPMLDPRQPVETEVDRFEGKFINPAESKFQVTVDNSVSKPFTFSLD